MRDDEQAGAFHGVPRNHGFCMTTPAKFDMSLREGYNSTARMLKNELLDELLAATWEYCLTDF